MVTQPVIDSPVGGKGEVRLGGKKAGLDVQISPKEGLISASSTRPQDNAGDIDNGKKWAENP
jgi:hypothetical protein